MYKTGALLLSSSKLLLPALAAASRLVTGVLYIPLDYVERVAALSEGGGGLQERDKEGDSSSVLNRENGGMRKEVEERQHAETKYPQETSGQVSLAAY